MQAMALLEAGKTQREVASKCGVTIRTIKRWKRLSLNSTKGSKPGKVGRPSCLSRVAKIVLAKSLTKRNNSAGKLATKLTAKGHQCSKTTAWRYLTRNLGCRAYRRQLVPKLTAEQKKRRLKFAKEHRNWTTSDWKQVLFSDESVFELHRINNRRNDVVYARNRRDVPPSTKSKFNQKIMVWGMIGPYGVSKLHILPNRQTVNAEYYQKVILTKFALPAIRRRRCTGSILQTKLSRSMSCPIFQQDGAKAHTAKSTLKFLSQKFHRFWMPEEWPANSPDLSPIENVWGIIKQKVDEKQDDIKTIDQLKKAVTHAWDSMPREMLESLYSTMSYRIKNVLQLKGDNI